MLLGGEAGIGKTRLAEEVLAEARQEGCLALTGRCYETESTAPFIPWVEVVERSAHIGPHAAFQKALGDSGPEVAKLVPELRQLFPDIPAPADLPSGEVAIVHDHYHVVANMNEVIDQVRRDEQNRLEGEGKQLIKGARYLLLRAKEKLAQLPDKQARLDALLAVNAILHKVYLLKEDLRLFWSQESKSEARDFIETWLSQAKALDNRHLTRFANTVESHIETILAWYDHPITSGPLEGLNNKIKVLKRSAYGYRDFAFFGLRLLFIHETKLQLRRRQ